MRQLTDSNADLVIQRWVNDPLPYPRDEILYFLRPGRLLLCVQNLDGEQGVWEMDWRELAQELPDDLDRRSVYHLSDEMRDELAAHDIPIPEVVTRGQA